MNLQLFNDNQNLLPFDGEVYYYPFILTEKEAKEYYERLMKNILWKQDEVRIYGKKYITKRKTAWYGDNNYEYTYSGTVKTALPFTAELKALKHIIESVSGCRYNSCLLNLYHSGEEGMSWHSDDEAALGKHSAIASLSLGANRIFSFKHKESKKRLSVLLENGSLLLMKGATQENWLHSLPKTKKVLSPRINLTFRTITGQ